MIQRISASIPRYNASLPFVSSASRRRSRNVTDTVINTSSTSSANYYNFYYSTIGRRNISFSRLCCSKWSVDSDTGVVSLDGTPRFQTVIGLEIHAQLDISTKLFSGCPVPNSKSNNSSNSNKPNSSVWPMDVGVPGVLPRLSAEAVRAAVLSAGAMKCRLPPMSRFERKHYFYADLPLGYQITQQRWPLARDGFMVFRKSGNNINSKKKRRKKKPKHSSNNSDDDDDDKFTLRIERVQLEQDTGKTLADAYTNPLTNRKESLVDFNRAGRALIEVVSHPDLRSSRQASIAVETLRSLFKHIGTCDGKMEDGSLRCDLNVSIATISDGNDKDNSHAGGSSKKSNTDCDILSRTGHRVEVKNLNSIRQVQQAAEYEALRQSKAILENDSPTRQETRTFDVKTNKTVVIRTKEGAKDYRFMPEPDLPPLVLDSEEALGSDGVEAFLEANLPELPDDARQRLENEYGLSEYLAGVITNDPPAIAFFDEAVREARVQLQQPVGDRDKRKIPGTTANLLCNELFALVREFELQRLIEEGLIDSAAAGGGGDSSMRFSRVTGYQLGEVVAMVSEDKISNTMAKHLLRVLYSDAMEGEEEPELENESSSTIPPSSTSLVKSPRAVARERGFELVTDENELATLCRTVIDSSPKEMERYKLGGKYSTKITKFLLGKAMGASGGNAHPERLNEVLAEILQEMAPLE
uniref:Glutamyl-tRNA(Gln) amidotransferase subunit B, mitochondrial n=1 Tax=Pseudo-nitzschia australis TaxID=44445 RepID=A0A7S4AF83_9STRA|mmetsp:Transcript_9485/g.20528  ORF Transcript_9485/g.20528 Transcript_9485/m.20528 type:complete len:697 (+) Transcript_9485:80-2170(+)